MNDLEDDIEGLMMQYIDSVQKSPRHSCVHRILGIVVAGREGTGGRRRWKQPPGMLS